ELLLVERAVLEERIEEDRGELAFPPEGKRSPRSAERQADVAVAERDRDSEGLRRPGGLEQLRTGLDAETPAELPLVRDEDQIDEERRELTAPDDLLQVERLEAVRARQRVEPRGVELDAHSVRTLALDDGADEIGGLPRD